MEPIEITQKYTILLVDDTPDNIALLGNLLKDTYKIKTATNGNLALKIASDTPPDLILLDIMMPGLSGYDVCDQLKQNPLLKNIPIIFISALNNAEHKLNAFQLGGVDYITKPFQALEVLARVKTHLSVSKMQLLLENQNHILEETVAARTVELEMAYKRLSLLDAVKGDFLKMISHEMRTPLNGLIGVSEVLFSLCPPSKELNDFMPYYEQSKQRLIQLIDDSLLINSLDSSYFNTNNININFNTLLADALSSINEIGVDIEQTPDSYNAHICCDCDLIIRAFTIFVRLSTYFNTKHNCIKLIITTDTKSVKLTIMLDTISLSDEQVATFFDLNTNVRGCSQAEEMALAPIVADRIFSLFGGKMEFSKIDAGGTLCVTLPIVITS